MENNASNENQDYIGRLTEILKFINYESDYRGKFALKGGTAINLLFFNIEH